MNFDPYDEYARLKIAFRNQDVVGSSEVASIQFGCGQIRRLLRTPLLPFGDDRPIGFATTSRATGLTTLGEQFMWKGENFTKFNLVPAGQVYVRFESAQQESHLCSWLSCCCPGKKQSRTYSPETQV